MKRSYWKQHYVLETDADEIERHLQRTTFLSGGKQFELIYFEARKNVPIILISQGSGGHAYVFAELGYQMHLKGYTVCIMPKHGGYTIPELMSRPKDALDHIAAHWNDRIGVLAEGLGGFVTFYLALTESPMKSAVFQKPQLFGPKRSSELPFCKAKALLTGGNSFFPLENCFSV